MSDLKHDIPLYCVSSLHSLSTYNWRKFGDPAKSRRFQSSAVIYLREEGLFECTVTYENQTLKSQLFDVTMDLCKF